MLKVFKKSYLLTALICVLVACLTCGTVMLSANAQTEAASVVKLTSFTTVMKVDESFQFAAQVTDEDGTVSNEVTWSSSDEDVIYIGNEGEDIGVAYALKEGSATITATAGSASASVNVLVSNSAIHVESVTVSPESLELGVGWHARVYASVLPTDAYDQGVHFASSDTSIITVTDDGYVTAVAGK